MASIVFLASCSALRPPAASVDGIKITDAQVAADLKLFTALSSLSRQACGTVLPGESAGAACARAALSSLIQEAFIKRYAQLHGITADPAEVQTSVDGLIQQLGGTKTIDPVLARDGVTSGQLRDLAARIVLLRDVRMDITKAALTDTQLQALYRQNIQQYTLLHAEHILVKTKGEADRVYRQVTAAGFTEKDFLDLAKKVSIDPSAKQNSGDLGGVSGSSLDPTFVAAAEALKPGQISRPVHTQFGWHVIRLVSQSATPFRTVRPDLEQQASAKAFDAWFTKQLEAADIRVNPKYGRWDPRFKVVLPIRSTATGTPAPATSSPAAATTAP